MANGSIATYERVYVWEFPVRLYHWVNAICIVVLIATGFLIGHPVSIFYVSEAYQSYWFGTVRFVHFVAAFVFFFMFLVRIYWGFVGNAYARWTNFIPCGRERARKWATSSRWTCCRPKCAATFRSATMPWRDSFTS